MEIAPRIYFTTGEYVLIALLLVAVLTAAVFAVIAIIKIFFDRPIIGQPKELQTPTDKRIAW